MPRAFAYPDLVVALAATGIACATALPVVDGLQDDARTTVSVTNLRSLGVAGATYAAEWNDRQFTPTPDDLSRFGDSLDAAVDAYTAAKGAPPAPIILGSTGDEIATIGFDDPENRWLLRPVSFDANPRGWFRALNNQRFTQYLSGRCYDPVLYAPKDRAVMSVVADAFGVAEEYVDLGDPEPSWSSYSWSAAALYHPEVLGGGEFTAPFSIPNALRCPAYSQCMYPDLKTHAMEHHWLQNRPQWLEDCRPGVEGSRYGGCEPYQFNHYAFSEPAALFYDGHVELVLTDAVLRADARIRAEGDAGLWFRAPGDAVNGFREDEAVDRTRTSYHVFTRDGIRGRDILRTPARR